MSFARNSTAAWVRHARLRLELNRTAGHHIYDFMDGDSGVKANLGLASSDMVWLVAQRSRLRFALEDYLRKIWDKRRRTTS